MSRITLTGAALVAGAVLLSLAPARADAQFGGLRRKLEQQVAKAAAGGREAERAPDAHLKDDNVLEITDARLAQLLAGLKVEAAQAEEDERAASAETAKAADYEKRSAEHARCAEPFNARRAGRGVG